MTLPSSQFPDLRDRGVLVTGGGSGIGAALVEAFARQGARVAFVDIAAESSLALCEKVAAQTGQAPHFIQADLRNVEAVRAAADEAVAKLGSVRVLVNNAARDDRQALEAVTEESWDESLSVNLRHLFFMCQAVAPHMQRQGGGSIVNFSSIAFLLNMPEIPAYSTAKRDHRPHQIARRQARTGQYPRQRDPARHDRYGAAAALVAHGRIDRTDAGKAVPQAHARRR